MFRASRHPFARLICSSLFGTPQSVASSGSSLFGTPQSVASSDSSLFGAAASGSPLFGTSSSTCSPVFGAAPGASSFGATASAASPDSPLFGTGLPPASSLFGTPSSSAAAHRASSFGATASAPSHGSPLFETSLPSAFPVFGTTPSSAAASGASLFGATASAASLGWPLFGTGLPSASLFGTPSSSAPAPGASLSGATASAASPGPPSASPVFGASLFGATASAASMAAATGASSLFGASTPAVSAFSVFATTSAATTASSASTSAASSSSLIVASTNGSAPAIPKLPSEIVSMVMPTSTATTHLQEANIGTFDRSSVPTPEPAVESTADLSDVESADLDAVDEILGVTEPRCKEPLPSTPVAVDDVKAKWELYQLTKSGYSQIASNSALQGRIKHLLAELSSGKIGFTKTLEFQHECEEFAKHFVYGAEVYRLNCDKIESSIAAEENFNELEDRLTAGKQTLKEHRSSYQAAVDRKAELTEEKERLKALLAEVQQQIESTQLEVQHEGRSMKQQLQEVVATMQEYDRQQAEVSRHLTIRRVCAANNKTLDEDLSNFRRSVKKLLDDLEYIVI
ncbi:hypothetical protein BT93_D1231 [Corymbia citriodora subsp. variegata]|nr:hypothetical protein BT93_D1231 [Corymbia citriodora subsp. variegata]